MTSHSSSYLAIGVPFSDVGYIPRRIGPAEHKPTDQVEEVEARFDCYRTTAAGAREVCDAFVGTQSRMSLGAVHQSKRSWSDTASQA